MRNYTIKNTFGCGRLFFKKHNFTYTQDAPNALICGNCRISAISSEKDGMKTLPFLLVLITFYLLYSKFL